MDTVIILYIIIIAFALFSVLQIGIIKLTDMIEEHYEHDHYKNDKIGL